MKQPPVLLGTAYLPNIQYFTKIITAQAVSIEKFEHYTKQTYRNRCVVLGANGPVNLTIPIEKSHKNRPGIRDVRIYNHNNWQNIHFRTLFSAYNSSPFYEFYADEFSKYYQKKQKFLFDFNLELLNWLFEQLGINPALDFTDSYRENPAGIRDYRNVISPKSKKADAEFLPVPYSQVFEEKFGFTDNLSVIDLLFNEGPNSLNILKQSSTNIE